MKGLHQSPPAFRSAAKLLVLVFICGTATAWSREAEQSAVVVPGVEASRPGSGSVFLANDSLLQVYGSSEFTSLGSEALLTSVTLRPDEALGVPFDARFSDVSIQLATFPEPLDNLSTYKGLAILGVPIPASVFSDASTVVGNSELHLVGSSSTSPTLPSPFDLTIQFDKSFLYNPKSGNLLMLIKFGTITTALGAGSRVDFDLPSDSTFPARASVNGELVQTMALPVQFGYQTIPEPTPVTLILLGLVTMAAYRYGTKLTRGALSTMGRAKSNFLL